MKPANTRLTAKKVALVVCFTALYAVFAAIPIFQLVGSAGRISAAAIMAPIIGVLLGPYLGTLSAFLGGTIGLSYGSFLPMSFVSGIVTTLCAGLLRG
jgi:predicted membrane protein